MYDYPRKCFVMDKKKTEENMRKYRHYQNEMYEFIESNIADFHKKTLRERHSIIKRYQEINPFEL